MSSSFSISGGKIKETDDQNKKQKVTLTDRIRITIKRQNTALEASPVSDGELN